MFRNPFTSRRWWYGLASRGQDGKEREMGEECGLVENVLWARARTKQSSRDWSNEGQGHLGGVI